MPRRPRTRGSRHPKEARPPMNEFPATGNDGRFYMVVRIPSSISRGALDGEVSQSGVYSYYLADGTRLNPVDDERFETVDGSLTVTVDFAR